MSTYTAIYINSGQPDIISQQLTAWIKQQHPSARIKIQSGDFPIEFYGKDFKIFDQGNPTLFAMASYPENWYTIHFNNFRAPEDLALQLSEKLSCTVIIVMAQSTSEAYQFSLYEKGQHRRSLAFAGDTGEWFVQEGTPLSFEASILGQGIFSRDEMILFCRQFGLTLWEDPKETPRWTLFRVRSSPWWKFW